MSDRYSQLVNAPRRRSTIAKQLGLPQPATLDRHWPGAPVVAGAGPLRRRARRPARQAGRAPPRRASSAERAGAEGQAKALVFDATGIADSTELVELQRFFYPAVGRLQRSGRVVVLGTPPARGRLDPRRHRPAGAGGLHPLARQGDRRPRHRPRSSSTSPPGAEDQLDSTLRFLLSPRSAYVSGQVVRIGAGRRASARDRLGAPARRQGRARHRRLARDRRRDRRRPSPATAPRSSGSTCPQAGRRPGDGDRARSAAERSSSTSPPPTRPERIADALRRRRRRRRPQRRRHPRPHDREDARGALGAADGDQPLQRGADQRRPARGAELLQPERPDRLRLLDGGHRRQLRPDQLRRLQGRA